MQLEAIGDRWVVPVEMVYVYMMDQVFIVHVMFEDKMQKIIHDN